MFESIEFKNFKALRDTTLPLSRFTLIVGPNGSGKSTALQAFSALRNPAQFSPSHCRSVGASSSERVGLVAMWKEEENDYQVEVKWENQQVYGPKFQARGSLQKQLNPRTALDRARDFSLDATALAAPVPLVPNLVLAPNGANLAGVLDGMRDQSPERFEGLNEQLGFWIPEFDQVLFETPSPGNRSLLLRTRNGGHKIPAAQLSQGTLIALALLTIALLPDPPSIVCLEEPDHGLHPRLLRDVRDVVYRLAYPEGANDKRDPVQVIATTHNPYFLDLFREHPEEVVIAEKVGLDATFSRLSDRGDMEDILGEALLSEVWYSGVLGGVPAGRRARGEEVLKREDTC